MQARLTLAKRLASRPVELAKSCQAIRLAIIGDRMGVLPATGCTLLHLSIPRTSLDPRTHVSWYHGTPRTPRKHVKRLKSYPSLLHPSGKKNTELKTNKPPGRGGILPRLLKEVLSDVLQQLSMILNMSVQSGERQK